MTTRLIDIRKIDIRPTKANFDFNTVNFYYSLPGTNRPMHAR